MTQPLLDLQPTADPMRFRMEVTPGICVGPKEHVFMFGGVGLASALGMAPANDPSVCRNDDATHPGIGIAQRHGLLRQL